jgi:nicotinate-nucleotide pyrophosphorylase (carboxylating)
LTDPAVSGMLTSFLLEDLGRGDSTTDALVPSGLMAKAVVRAKESGVLAGVTEIRLLARLMGISVVPRKLDGEVCRKGANILEIEGEARSILHAERTILNLLGHMSGVATFTRKAVREAQSVNPQVRVAATRKTLPGLRLLEKKAVVLGGGDPHRYDLSGTVLIKDNHIKVIGGIGEAVTQAKKSVSFTSKVEVEVNDLRGAIDAVQNGANIIMLDNMSPEAIKKIVKILEEKGLRSRIILEASGNITLQNIRKYAVSGIDVVSMGALTNSSKALDFSLKITEIR